MDFEWYNPKIKTPIISINRNGINFQKNAIKIINNPEYIKLGYDKTNNIICIKACNKNDGNRIRFKSKNINNYVRIIEKHFIQIISSKNNILNNKSYKYVAEFDNKQNAIFVNLNMCIEIKNIK